MRTVNSSTGIRSSAPSSLIPVILLALATIHLASYPLHQWIWRAPVFALVESAVESLFSLVLIFAGRERWGTGRAVFGDWPAMAATTFLSRFAMVCLFALVLGGVAQFVRRREIQSRAKEGASRWRERSRRRRGCGTPRLVTNLPLVTTLEGHTCTMND